MSEKPTLPEMWLKGEIDRVEMVTDVKVVARLLAATRRSQNALISHAKWMEERLEGLWGYHDPKNPHFYGDEKPARYCAICLNKECDHQGTERGTSTCQWNPPGPKEPEKVYPFDCSNCGNGKDGGCPLPLSECSGENDFARWARPLSQLKSPAWCICAEPEVKNPGEWPRFCVKCNRPFKE